MIELDGKKIKLQIFDAIGLERCKELMRRYYHDIMGFLIVYDITQEERSFNRIKFWIKEIEEFANRNVEMMILGNKCDQKTRRLVSRFVQMACFLNHCLFTHNLTI